MDNRLFIVNGKGKDTLLETIKLAVKTAGYRQIDGFRIDEKKGFVLLWHCNNGITIDEKTPEGVFSYVESYLESDAADYVEKKQWEQAYDSYDVTDQEGWVVYCEDWGHIGIDPYAIVAIKKAYLWYGK